MAVDLYCKKNDCYKAGARLDKVEYLIVHSPAVWPDAVIRARSESGSGGGWYKRWNKPGVAKLTHGVIDDTGVYNFAPYWMAVWQVGNSYGNSHCIGYELCELNTAAEFQIVWNNAVNHYAALCKEYNLSSDKVIGHYEAHDRDIASNHSDPEPYFRRFGKSMKDFREDVKKKLLGQQEERPEVTKVYNPWAYGRVTGLTSKDPYLNVRSGPDMGYGVIRRLANGNEVDVLEMYKNGWAKINIINQEAYAYSGYLVITERGSQEEKPSYAAWVGRVSGVGTSRLNVRTGPGTGYDLLKEWPKLAEGNLVGVKGESGDWYQIEIAGQYNGWASKEYIKK